MESSVGLFLLFIPAKIDGYLNEQKLENKNTELRRG